VLRKPAVHMPMEVSTQMLLIKHREEIEKYTRLPFAGYDLISHVQDKGWLMKFAISHNISCPETFFPDNPAEAEMLRDSLDYPAVIKPRDSSGSRGIVYVKNAADLTESYRTVHKKFPRPVIQEYIPNGGAFGVGALFNNSSEPRASFVYKRLREYPVTGGPSTLRESIHNKEVEDIALSLLKLLKWTGIAMVEFRVDARNGVPKLMEINPRFWGSLQLAILSGVDFPYLLYKMAADGDIEPVNNYKTGINSRWLIPGDIMHFLHNPDRFRMSPGFFSFKAKDDIISLDDPMPTLGRISSLLPLVYKREMKTILFK
jgi:predicted ATP-grasp superfamily ATP-dependent carboligase